MLVVCFCLKGLRAVFQQTAGEGSVCQMTRVFVSKLMEAPVLLYRCMWTGLPTEGDKLVSCPRPREKWGPKPGLIKIKKMYKERSPFRLFFSWAISKPSAALPPCFHMQCWLPPRARRVHHHHSRQLMTRSQVTTTTMRQEGKWA